MATATASCTTDEEEIPVAEGQTDLPVWLLLFKGANARLEFLDKGDQMLVKEYPTRRHSDQRWRIAFENSAIGIAMADFTGRFLAANNAFLDMLGYTESELYQLTFIDSTYKEDLERNLRLLKEPMEGKRKHFEIEKRYCRKDSSLVWARTNVALVPVMGAGTAPFWFAIVEDITEWKQAEKELLTGREGTTHVKG
jgi:PAS domain S-box-containing protein